MSRKFRLAAAAVSAVALTSMTLAPAAFAEDTAATGGPAYTAEVGNIALINPEATANLHLTKYAGAPVNYVNDGTPQGVLDGVTALEGVQYKVYKVTDADLLTNAGWEAAAKYYEATPAAPTAQMTQVQGPGEGGAYTTDALGKIDISDLALGLYYVQEVSAPAGYTMAAPFMVTLPMTQPTDLNTWMYDVYVYPKNQNDTITKTVVDEGTVTTENGAVYGDAADHKIVYTVTTSITDGTKPLEMYVINDQLDPSLTFVSETVVLKGTRDGAPVEVALTAGEDYTISTEGNLVKITMTADGRTKLEANRDLEVVTTINTTVGAKDADGIVPNTATFIPNKDWYDQNDGMPGIPSEEVVTKYGDAVINKYDGGAPTTKLGGAEFVVYADADGNDTCDAAEMIAGNKIMGPVTTAADGSATFVGLQASDFYNNEKQTDLITYCLVETKAPEGYNLNAQPIAFTIMQDGTTQLYGAKLDVANEKTNLNNELPLTGGQGTALLSLAGLMLVAGGAGYYFVSNRRREEAQN